MKLIRTCGIPFNISALPTTVGLVIDFDSQLGINKDASNNLISWTNQGTLGGSVLPISGSGNFTYLSVDPAYGNNPSINSSGARFIDFNTSGVSFVNGASIFQVLTIKTSSDVILWEFCTSTNTIGNDLYYDPNHRLGLNTFKGNTQGATINNLDKPNIIGSLLANANYNAFRLFVGTSEVLPLTNLNGFDNNAISPIFTLFRANTGTRASTSLGTVDYQVTGSYVRNLVYNRILTNSEVSGVLAYLYTKYLAQ